MGKVIKTKEKQKNDGSGCLTSVLFLLIFTALLGTYVLHQCAMWQEVSYKHPSASRLMDELQLALGAYNADSEMNKYPAGELNYHELLKVIAPYHKKENDWRYNDLISFEYYSEDGTTYKITAQLDTGKEIIFSRTPEDAQKGETQ